MEKTKQAFLLPIFTFAVLLSSVSAVTIGFGMKTGGSCPTTVKVQQNFVPEKYFGRWYEHSRSPNFFELGLECVTADYGKYEGDTQNISTSLITVVNRGIKAGGGQNGTIKIKEVIGTGRIPDPLEPAKLKVNFGNGPEGNYWVLGTDYENYSAVWSCTTIVPGFLRMENAWILTRSRNVTEDVSLRAFILLNRGTGLVREDLMLAQFSVFEKFCRLKLQMATNESPLPEEVKVVPNFDTRRYMGPWYEYARTNNWFEWGLKCVKAEYELKPDGQTVLVTNSGVRDYPFLWKTTKVKIDASVPDPSQPAKLRVGGGSGPPNYCVVDTDYENYSAIFSPVRYAFGMLVFNNAWIITRDKNGPTNTELLEKAYVALEKCGIKREQLLKTKQDCDN